MAQRIAHISLLVNDYDEAIEFYTKKLYFSVVEDKWLSATKRWVLIAPNDSTGCSLLLAKAATDSQKSFVGNQTGGRVFLFLYTNDFEQSHQMLIQNNIQIVREPVEEAWGKVLVFADLYGNLWDLIAPTNP